MDVLVERYQRRKYVNQEDAPLLYYIRQKSGNVRVMDVDTMATAIESKSSLTAGDVKHTIEAFVEQLRLSLTQGDKVKIDGLGTFHITLTSDGTESMKDCTVRSIRRVNVLRCRQSVEADEFEPYEYTKRKQRGLRPGRKGRWKRFRKRWFGR